MTSRSEAPVLMFKEINKHVIRVHLLPGYREMPAPSLKALAKTDSETDKWQAIQLWLTTATPSLYTQPFSQPFSPSISTSSFMPPYKNIEEEQAALQRRLKELDGKFF